MLRLLIIAALSLALAACATAQPGKLAACDGQHRRPANPNGSILAATTPPATPPAAPAAAKPSRAARPLKTAALAASYAPCGGRA